MISSAPSPLEGCKKANPPSTGNFTNANVFICDREVHIYTQSCSYDVSSYLFVSLYTSYLSGSLRIEKPTIDTMPHSPKGV